MAADVRPPAVAGTFYPADGKALAESVEGCFLDPRGPGSLPDRRRSAHRRIAAIVVPHAGLVFSGAIAAHAYRAVAEERPPDSVLVLGVDHYGTSQGAALSTRPWATPLGPTGIDPELARALERGPVAVDEAAHRREHSIEVQLPFLEYVLPRPTFVPLMVRHGPLPFLEKVAAVVRDAVAERDTLLVASTDFSHYVAPDVADRLDHRALEPILARDAARLYDVVGRESISMCGIAPTTVLLAALAGRRLSARLLRWGHSGEVAPGREVVGYAAVVLEEDGGAALVK